MEQMTLTVSMQLKQGLNEYARAEEMNQNDAAVNLIDEALTSKGIFGRRPVKGLSPEETPESLSYRLGRGQVNETCLPSSPGGLLCASAFRWCDAGRDNCARLPLGVCHDGFPFPSTRNLTSEKQYLVVGATQALRYPLAPLPILRVCLEKQSRAELIDATLREIECLVPKCAKSWT